MYSMLKHLEQDNKLTFEIVEGMNEDDAEHPESLQEIIFDIKQQSGKDINSETQTIQGPMKDAIDITKIALVNQEIDQKLSEMYSKLQVIERILGNDYIQLEKLDLN